ncbi:hypothetical protein T4B_8464 [Trichinella pseudospiralis]|uniref:Uncharacterized protein n=1 Tax=Trichinella pseudospiralis TaxID=6337 RepID=A0A0V1GAF7_TRIPS|nr:hypothetical protein T4B_8464 [Trichinella pseudospiralis]
MARKLKITENDKRIIYDDVEYCKKTENHGK